MRIGVGRSRSREGSSSVSDAAAWRDLVFATECRWVHGAMSRWANIPRLVTG